jgi:hypothetical protein
MKLEIKFNLLFLLTEVILLLGWQIELSRVVVITILTMLCIALGDNNIVNYERH